MRFWVTERGCSAAFLLRLDSASSCLGAAPSAGWFKTKGQGVIRQLKVDMTRTLDGRVILPTRPSGEEWGIFRFFPCVDVSIRVE